MHFFIGRLHTGRILTGLAFALVALTANGGMAFAQDNIDIHEWDVPFENSRPRDPFAVSETSVWFVGQAGGYLAHLNPQSGEFQKVDLKDGSHPHNLIVGGDGAVWYAGNRTALIGRYDPATGEIEEIAMPDPAARDPHTLIFDGDETHIYFTLQGANMMGRLTIADRKVDLIASKTERARPYGIKLAPDGSVFVALFGTNKLARIDPQTLALTEIELPRAETRPRRLEVTPDGRVWYVDYAKGMLGVYNPADETFREWQMPQGENARPYGMASDDLGRLWMVATGVKPNILVGFDPDTKEFFGATPVPSGGGAVRHMHFHQPGGTVWFGADTNTVGRAVVSAKK